jgi:hypothetical protein
MPVDDFNFRGALGAKCRGVLVVEGTGTCAAGPLGVAL